MECRLDMAGNTCRSRALVYGPCGACSSSIHPRVVNSSVSLLPYGGLIFSASTRARVVVCISVRNMLRALVIVRASSGYFKYHLHCPLDV